MEFVVRHYIPGRIRLHIPMLCERRSLAESALAWLRKQGGVKTARINYECASLVVEYDRTRETVLHDLVGRLRLMTLDELRLLIGLAGVAQGKSPAPKPSGAAQPFISRRAPLALPTLSLLLAFSANPIVRAVNLPFMLWNA